MHQADSHPARRLRALRGSGLSSPRCSIAGAFLATPSRLDSTHLLTMQPAQAPLWLRLDTPLKKEEEAG